MLSTRRKLIIAAGILVVLGAVFWAAALASSDFDIKNFGRAELEEHTYDVSGTFRSIRIDADTEVIGLMPSEDGHCRVVCLEEKDTGHEVAVESDVLTIRPVDNRKWTGHFGILAGEPRVSLYLPEKAYAELVIKTDTGDIDIPADFSFESVSIRGSTADVSCLADVSGLADIGLNTGDIKLSGLNAGEIKLSTTTGKIRAESVACRGDVALSVDTGGITLSDVSCKNLRSAGDTGDIELKNVLASGQFDIQTNTGDVRFEGSDATEIFVRTGTGEVSGTLLSDKVFIIDTDTGDVDVPRTVTGGRCEITTDTGDIEISVK
ncbi:MAG: DUF4097 family beta strand repeat protein [Oscillospiraceae bacterium]|nr:DUF4097 family beta strand repeat protein [Oscillospiraceae bacterium]